MGFPLIPPYAGVMKNMTSNRNSIRGVNFAVAGATAVDISFLQKRGVKNPATNVSLGTELEWFKQMLPILCNSPTSKTPQHHGFIHLIEFLLLLFIIYYS